MIRFVDEIGRMLQTAELSVAPISVGSVLALDASDVLWEVTAVRQSPRDVDVVVRVTDDRSSYIDIDRTVATTPPTTRFHVAEDGVRLAVHALGGSGPPLIVCHATGFHSFAYAPMARALAPHFSVYAIDFRCHGESDSDGPRRRSWRGLVPDLRAAVAHVESIGGAGEPIRAFGHSMGGTAILATQLAHPGTFHSAFVYEPIVTPSPSAPGGPPRLAPGARRRQETFRSRAEARDRFSRSGAFVSFRSDALAAYVQHGLKRFAPGDRDGHDGPSNAYRLRCAPEDEATFYEGSDPVVIDDLDGLELRLFIAAGDENDQGPAKLASLAAGRLNTDVDSLAGLGHFGPFEDPDRVARSLVEKLAPPLDHSPEVPSAFGDDS